ALTLPYPQALRQAMIDTFLWEAEFAIANARHGRALDDAVYAAGCAFRCVACLCQVLCAINGVYLLNEKGGTGAVEGLSRRPDAFRHRVLEAFGAIGSARTAEGLNELDCLVRETQALWLLQDSRG